MDPPGRGGSIGAKRLSSLPDVDDRVPRSGAERVGVEPGPGSGVRRIDRRPPGRPVVGLSPLVEDQEVVKIFTNLLVTEPEVPKGLPEVPAALGRVLKMMKRELQAAIRAANSKGGRRRRRSPEHDAQVSVVSHLRHSGVVFNAQNNGLFLSKRLAADAKRAGTEAGAPDLLLFESPAFDDRCPLSDAEAMASKIIKGLPPARRAMVLVAAGVSPGVALEMKTEAAKPKTGRAHHWSGARPSQREYLAKLIKRGWFAIVGHGRDDAVTKLERLGVLGSGRVDWYGDPSLDPAVQLARTEKE